MLTRNVTKLNNEGDYVISYHDGERLIGASLIEAKHAKEQLKGEQIDTPVKMAIKMPKALAQVYVSKTAEPKPQRQAKEKESVAVPSGPSFSMSAKQLRAEVLKGSEAFNKHGKKVPCKVVAEKTPDRVLQGTCLTKGKIKTYYINNF